MNVSGTILNRARSKLASGELALGLIIRLARHFEAGGIAAISDHDFILIDCQHVSMSRDTVTSLIQGAHSAGVAPIVRVRGYDDPAIPVYLDAGALGLIAPNINSAVEARAFVDAARFPPIGRRSLPGPVGFLGYQSLGNASEAAAMDRETLLLCMIETVQGLEEHSDIVSVDGVDGLHVGAVDLLSSLGDGRSLADPIFQDHMLQIISSCVERGKACGIGGERDLERLRKYINAGAHLLTSQIDATLLIDAATKRTQALRAYLAK